MAIKPIYACLYIPDFPAAALQREERQLPRPPLAIFTGKAPNYFVLAANATLTEAELLDFLRERLARYKVPKTVVFVEALPKTGAGKIDKQRLVERYGQPE